MKNRLKKFPLILLCVTLVLTFFVTGVTKPGFLLPLFTPKVPTPADVNQTLENLKSDEEAYGHSRAFRIEPEPGLTIYADDNALDHDRDFTVTRCTDTELQELEEYVYSCGETDLHVLPIAGWHVDAGMGPDDLMPGVINMDFYLPQYGIPADMYYAVQAYHIDENGVWREYVTEVDGDTLHIQSRQNELMFLGVSIYTYLALGGGMAAINEFQTMSWLIGMGSYPVYENEELINVGVNGQGKQVYNIQKSGRKLYTLRAYFSDEQKHMLERAKIRTETIMKSVECKEKAQRLLDAGAGSNLGICREIAAAEMIKTDEEYLSLTDTLYKDLESEGNFTPLQCFEMSKLVRTAHNYLENGAKLKMPTYVPEIYMKGNYTQDGVTVTTFPFGRAYCVIRTSDLGESQYKNEELLLTITHEMTHMVQREYCISSFSNVKFDEATAQLMEEQSMKWYKAQASPPIVNDHYLKNSWDWEYLALEMNGFSTTTWYTSAYDAPTTKSFGNIFLGKKSDASYILVQFINYIWELIGSPYGEGTGITWDQLFSTYKKFWTTPTFTELIMKAFSITTKGDMDQKLYGFAEKYAAYFIRAAQGDTQNKCLWAYPNVGLWSQNGAGTKLINNDLTIKTRLFRCCYPVGYTKKVALIVQQEEGFAEANSDTKLISAGPVTGQKCRYGAFYPPSSIANMEKTGFIEADGFSKPKNSKDKAVGYKVWTMIAPEPVEPEKKDYQIRFQMPEKSDVAEAKLIKGYRVTVTPNRGGSKKEFLYNIDISGKFISLNYSDILDKDFIKKIRTGEEKDETISFRISICEYFEDPDKTKHFGPESDDSGLEALLEEMGAHNGKVTITLHWFGRDDLDLHCNTPNGGHIYYSNKNADGGYLDVDMNIEGDRDEAIEHIYFDEPPEGEYAVHVNNYHDRTEGGVLTELIVTVENKQIIHEILEVDSGSPTYKFKIDATPGQREGEEYYIGTPLASPTN